MDRTEAVSGFVPKLMDWKDLDGQQVIVRVIRAEGLEQVYLMAKEAIYLISEKADGEPADE